MPAVAFLAPAALIGLLALPALYWLLRLSPPRPERVTFPPLALLFGIRRPDQTPARLPWWLMALRLAIAAALILAAAGPVLSPAARPQLAPGPLWLIVDNGFAAAPDWSTRLATADAWLADNDQPVLLAATADGPARDFTLVSADEARRRLKALAPRAWFPARDELLGPLAKLAARTPPAAVMVLLAPGDDGSATDFAGRLAAIAGAAPMFVSGDRLPPPLALADLGQDATGVVALVRRTGPDAPASGLLRLVDRRGRSLDERAFTFDGDATETTVRLDLPLELKNLVARAELADVASAAAVHLVDDAWRRRAVGILAASGYDDAQPLLSPGYFLERALAPFADVRPARSTDTATALKAFADDGVSAIILADYGRLDPDESAAARAFMARGGVLIRFAGPHFAAADDPLVPVALRHGDRILGGALSWESPRKLDAFPVDGPFGGLKVPDDVAVTRQVLAEPSVDLSAHTWASLADGTPLVTARPMGAGWLVLFHVAADTRWSNLPISGTFVEMLRRTVGLGRSADGHAAGEVRSDASLPPLALLDGWGRPGETPAETHGLPLAERARLTPSRANPAGLYGNDDAFAALNLMRPESRYVATATDAFGARAVHLPLAGDNGVALEPWLFAMAFALLLVDGLIVLTLTGRLGRRHITPFVAALLLAAGLLSHVDAARAADDEAIAAMLATTRLAYVETGDPAIDDVTRTGLRSLTDFIASRSSLEPGDPVAVDPEHDDLALQSLIYWPIDAAAPPPNREAMRAIDTFMRSGGTVLFDTRDALSAPPGGSTPEQQRLSAMLAQIDVPPLEPVPTRHVLTKSFYLINAFPGRYASSPLWVEATAPDSDTADRPVRLGDGVSPILITGNDFAGAWAADTVGTFRFPLVPGTPEQRDYAFRAGVNIVMYVLTGNYKADQVHVPALIQRLGR
jgi:hypothetical protein